MRFWDSSAVIPLCVNDPSTATVRRLARENEAIAAWWGTVVECCSALSRLLRQGDLSVSDLTRARHLLDRLAEGWSEVAPGPEVRDQAIRLLGLLRCERMTPCNWRQHSFGPIGARGATTSSA